MYLFFRWSDAYFSLGEYEMHTVSIYWLNAWMLTEWTYYSYPHIFLSSIFNLHWLLQLGSPVVLSSYSPRTS